MFSDLWRIAFNGGQQGQQAHTAPDQILDVQKVATTITVGP